MLLLAVPPLVCIEQLGSQFKDFRISDIGKRFEKLWRKFIIIIIIMLRKDKV